MLPTPDQIAAYRRDGFLVVERFLDADEVARLRERFAACFAHEWETGLRPDEVNYDPASTPPDLTRQICNAWKADRAVAATVLSARNAEFGAALAGVPGLRLAQDNLIWKPPSGKALLCHQDAAYLDHLDPPNMTTCWMALDDTSADTGTIYYVRGSNHWPHAQLGGDFHAPADRLPPPPPATPGAARPRPRVHAGRRRARARADRGPGRRRGLPRRLDVPRLAAQRARRPRASLERQPHDPDGDAPEPRAPTRRLLEVPPARRGRDRRGVLPRHVARGRPPHAVHRQRLRRR